jgi:eukaryotic-like serine/threonine-protein kinase
MTALGRYEIREILGQGGFARVFRAWDPALQREVALKTLLPHLADDPTTRQRFLDEARRIAGMRHPHIVVVLDVGEAEGRPFFAMELIDGPSLSRLIDDANGMELGQVARIVAGLGGALDYLHAAGLIHRDIKPANVMLDRAGRVVLMDFGISRALSGPKYTRSSVIIGTPEAMAPEQIRGEDIGPPADIYAFGILTYEMLAGRPPFEGELTRVLYQHAYEPPPPLRDRCPGLPEPVYAAVEAALAKDPARRPATASDFAEIIAEAAGFLAPRPVDMSQRITGGSIPFLMPSPPAGVARPPVTPSADAEMTRPMPGRITPAPGVASAPPDAPATPPAGAPGRRRPSPVVGAAGVAALLVVVLAGFLLMRRAGQSDGGSLAQTTATPAPTVAASPPPSCNPSETTVLVAGCPAAAVTLMGDMPVRLRFDGTKGQRLSLAATRVMTSADASVDIAILTPDGNTWERTSAGKDGRDFDMPPLPASGAYTVTAAVKGGGSLTLALSPELSGKIEAGGDPVSVMIERPGQNARLTFEASQGQRGSLAVTRVQFGGSMSCCVQVSVISPDTVTAAGKAIATASVGPDGKALRADQLPQDGTYAVLVNPGLFTGSLTLTLSDESPSDKLVAGGPQVPVTIDRVGRAGLVTFDGTKGQRLAMGITQVRFGDASPEIAVVAPDGKQIASTTTGSDGRKLDVPALPSNGAYTVVVSAGLATGSLTLTLSLPAATSVATNGPTVTATISRPGQSARLTFDGKRGQILSVAATRVRFEGGGCCVEIEVTEPDDDVVGSASFGADGKDIDLKPLPADGKYTIVVDTGVRLGTMQIGLSEDISMPLPAGDQGATVNIDRSGQNARLTFEGRQGQQVLITVPRLTFETGCCTPVVVALLTPDGETLVSANETRDTKPLDTKTLPVNGTYTVLVNPGLLTGGINVRLRQMGP